MYFYSWDSQCEMLTIILNGVKKHQAVDKLKLIHVPCKYGCLCNSPPQEAFYGRDLSKKIPKWQKRPLHSQTSKASIDRSMTFTG